MALKRDCDNPACDVKVDVDAGTVNDLPAGWWLLEHAAAVGAVAAVYTLCSLPCVAAVAELFADD